MQKIKKFVAVKIVPSFYIVDETLRAEVFKNNKVGKSKDAFSLDWQGLFDGAVIEKAFDFRVVNA